MPIEKRVENHFILCKIIVLRVPFGSDLFADPVVSF